MIKAFIPKFLQTILSHNIKINFVSAKYKNDRFIIRWIKANSTRDISGYENKSKKDLVKVLRETKTKTKIKFKKKS